ncbi:MAG: YibE/F family protein [Candidatus Magasanikbacteria bacterium]|nr:YibE/F family protein [Candidatus Magasanikbacteria bacterium]
MLPFQVFAAPANNPSPSADIYSRARVLSIGTATSTGASDENQAETAGQPALTARLKMLSGPDKGKQITAQYEPGIAGQLRAGDAVVVDKPNPQDEFYYIVDPYRINRLILFILLFFAVAIYFGRRRGVFAILGLVISVLIIFYYLIPRIIAGGSPLGTSLVAALLITIISLFVAHGVSRRTTIAFASTILSLAMAIITDLALVYTTKLTGSGSEEAAYLQFGTSPVNLQGVLLAGILIGVLGILDDITTAQAACVEEIHYANPTLTFKELYRRGLSVGREHIASLINTLVLAYVGVSLPIILLMVSSKGGSLWVVMNSGFMAEEIVRALVGSLVLVVAVPLTTFLAAYFYDRWPLL